MILLPREIAEKLKKRNCSAKAKNDVIVRYFWPTLAPELSASEGFLLYEHFKSMEIATPPNNKNGGSQ